MNAEMIAALRELEREKGIAFETILAGLEEAMASAYKSWWKQQHPDLDEEAFGRDPPRVGVPLHVCLAEIHFRHLTQRPLRRLSLCPPIRLLHNVSSRASWLAAR